MIQSEIFLHVSLRSTAVCAEATFVLIFLMIQLVAVGNCADVLEGPVVDCIVATILFSYMLAEGDRKK